jgi:hypothetical protein
MKYKQLQLICGNANKNFQVTPSANLKLALFFKKNN